MSVSRRKFLKSSAALSAALVLKPGTLILGQESDITSVQLRPYSRAMFERCLGDTFRVRAGKKTIDLKLVGLADLKPSSADITTRRTKRTDCFSLRFHATAPLPAAARTHTLSHNVFDSFDLFMTQSKEGAKFLQTAIVNHV
jgi:hypothetical protein